jgi:hypothetical protein
MHLTPRPAEPPTYTATPRPGTTTVHSSVNAPPPYHEVEDPSYQYHNHRDTFVSAPNLSNSFVSKGKLPDMSEKKVFDDTLHFLDHETDTISSLSLRYSVPAEALRRANNLTSDNLLSARRTILIPGAYYRGGVSLSPRPVGGEDEERRKVKVRKFMTTCKVSDYDVALLYLDQAHFDLELAMAQFHEDDAWESTNPVRGRDKGKTFASRMKWWPWKNIP